jgi:hypothetical protein
MNLLREDDAVYREWRRIIVRYSVSGVQVYDARLAAAVLVHRIQHILTLNVADFNRYNGVMAVYPGDV